MVAWLCCGMVLWLCCGIVAWLCCGIVAWLCCGMELTYRLCEKNMWLNLVLLVDFRCFLECLHCAC